ncbi:MAG: hypothetical protein GEU98_03920, partial [Pseudonocardiaceae bacterium]|nr:hypothetical protein [Pseudonocardiaceae bacterium]
MSSLAMFAPLATGAVSTAGWLLSARATRRLRHELRTDRLTGLANRDALIDRFTQTTRPGGAAAVGLL